MMTKRIIAGIITIMLFSSRLAFGQSAYKMKPVQIQTRWAKEVSAVNALPEYPRPQMAREQWQNLNGLWDYAITEKDGRKPASFDGKILVPYPIESALSGVKKGLQPEQSLWYRKTFKVLVTPALRDKGTRTLLHFGAVDYQATVLVNGIELGQHTGGYQNFSFDITDQLKAGNNELLVKVWDPTDKGPNPHGKQVLNPSGIMYTPSSGIWQTVWLEAVPVVSVESLKMTPDIDKGILRLQVNSNSGNGVYTIKVVATAKGQIVGKRSWVADNQVHELPLKGVGGGRLWSPNNPFLYDLQIQILKNGKVVDEVKSYFGMRKIEIKKDAKGIERIFLNNKYTYNLGTLDQGFWPDGLYTAPTDAALKFDIEAAKAMGFNTIRKHIKIEPARWYYYTDKLGMLVWQDMVNPGNDTKEGRQEFEKENKETIEQLYNHPSITTWVLFNEGWGAYDQPRLTKWMKETDPSRIVNGHTGENYFKGSPQDVKQKWADSDMTDIHAYPPPNIPAYLPGKARVVGEFGGIGVSVENHLWNDLIAGWGYDGTVNPLTMVRQYTAMNETLKKMETEGLSGSIYTQPFDVESEQNGLMTYDREIIKMPIATLRKIHSRLWPITTNYAAQTKGFSAKLADTLSQDYIGRLAAYKNGQRDTGFLRSLALVASAQKDMENLSKISNEYIRTLKDPFTESNLKFIQKFTKSSSDYGFNIFYKHADRVNNVLGKDEAEAKLTVIIENEEIKPNIPASGKPDWNAIEKEVITKYGALGEETVWQFTVFYSTNYKNWEDFGRVGNLWFEKYGKKRKWNSAGLLNNMAFNVFKNASDTVVLQTALNMMKHALTLESDSQMLDTYANLWYKLGRTEEALVWQGKAVAGALGDEEIEENFKKMKAGTKTW